ncbi:MAG: aminotransferase class V-fold PLP-dependent enzyme [Thermomicrobiales bacterium]
METDFYARLGVRTPINCATTYTRLGGSVMPRRVAQAMADAAPYFVNIWELQDAIGKRLAALTNNEAAYVSNGAAAGLALATAACMTGDDLGLMARLPLQTDGMKNEVVVHRVQRNWYDIAIRQVGATIVEIGHSLETQAWELDAAINERTAAVFYFAGSHLNRNTLPLPFVVEHAHARGVPVIVDAAAQLPPVSNLWKFTRDDGADAVIFSGGKGLRGPQNSGLVLGSEKIIQAITLNGPPHQRIGRSLKMSKEAMIGLLTAVELWLETDFDAEALVYSETVDRWLGSWQHIAESDFAVYRLEFNEAGEQIPRVILEVQPGTGCDRDTLVRKLRDGNPSIEVVLHDDRSIAFSPHLLQPGEAEAVERRVLELLSSSASRGGRDLTSI